MDKGINKTKYYIFECFRRFWASSASSEGEGRENKIRVGVLSIKQLFMSGKIVPGFLPPGHQDGMVERSDICSYTASTSIIREGNVNNNMNNG